MFCSCTHLRYEHRLVGPAFDAPSACGVPSCECADFNPDAAPPESLNREMAWDMVARALRHSFPEKASEVFAAFQNYFPLAPKIHNGALFTYNGNIICVESMDLHRTTLRLTITDPTGAGFLPDPATNDDDEDPASGPE